MHDSALPGPLRPHKAAPPKAVQAGAALRVTPVAAPANMLERSLLRPWTHD